MVEKESRVYSRLILFTPLPPSWLEPAPVVLCFQAGKKPVRAVLWVSADGLRVVDDKTKVRGLSGRPWKVLETSVGEQRRHMRGLIERDAADNEANLALVWWPAENLVW